MNTCKTCKFWSRVGMSVEGLCDKVDCIIRDKKLTFEINAEADDDSGMTVQLITGEDFGCVHHESK